WPFRDAMLAPGGRTDDDRIAEAVRILDLDPARFAADRVSDPVKSRVASDVEIGTRLGIPGTPSVFLDDRLVHDTSRAALEILIPDEIESARDRIASLRRAGLVAKAAVLDSRPVP